MNGYKKKLRRVLEIMEFQDIDDVMKMDMETLEKLFEYHTNIVKTQVRRNKQLSDEIEELYERKDMMEFAQFVGKNYILEGQTKWLHAESGAPSNMTMNDLLNQFEKEKEDSKKIKSSDVDGKDITEILFG